METRRCTSLRPWVGGNWRRFCWSLAVIKMRRTNKMRLLWTLVDGRTWWRSSTSFRILLQCCRSKTRMTRPRTLLVIDHCLSPDLARATRSERKPQRQAKKMIMNEDQSEIRRGWVLYLVPWNYIKLKPIGFRKSKNKWKLKDRLVLLSF